MQNTCGVQTVSVSLNEGLTVLDLKEGNGVTLLVAERPEDSGFVSRRHGSEGRGVVSEGVGAAALAGAPGVASARRGEPACEGSADHGHPHCG